MVRAAIFGSLDFAFAAIWWDAYLIYGPKTRSSGGGDDPPQPISSGHTVIGAREELERILRSLLREG